MENSSAQLLPKGCVIVSTRATIGEVTVAKKEVATNQGFKSVHPKKAESDYIAYYLTLITDELENLGRTTTYPEVNKTQFSNIEVPLPPIHEQKEIVQKLNSITSKIEETQKTQKEAEELANNILKSCIYSLTPEKEGSPYESMLLEDVCEVILGNSPPGDSYNQDGEGVRFLQGQKEFQEKTPASDRYTTEPSRMCEKGDVLIAVRATPLGIINFADRKYCLGRGVAGLRPKDCLDNRYLYYYMKIQHSYWETVSTGSTYPSITKTNLQNLPIALPPREIQDEIVSKLEQVEEKTDGIYQAVTRMDKVIDSLSDAILEKAFKGELSNGSPQPESDWAKESQSSLNEF